MLRSFLNISFPFYNANQKGYSALFQIFQTKTDVETYKELLNLFILDYGLDVLQES